MRKRIFYLINIFFILSLQILALNFTNSEKVEQIFQQNEVKGTFVVYNPQSNSFIEQRSDFIQHLLLRYIIL